MCRSSAVQMKNCREFPFSPVTHGQITLRRIRKVRLQQNIAAVCSDFEKSGQMCRKKDLRAPIIEMFFRSVVPLAMTYSFGLFSASYAPTYEMSSCFSLSVSCFQCCCFRKSFLTFWHYYITNIRLLQDIFCLKLHPLSVYCSLWTQWGEEFDSFVWCVYNKIKKAT